MSLPARKLICSCKEALLGTRCSAQPNQEARQKEVQQDSEASESIQVIMTHMACRTRAGGTCRR